MMRGLGKISTESSVLLLCDMQERFRNAISHCPAIISTCLRVLNFADVLKVPVVATEQYPKGLGRIMPELMEGRNLTTFTKTKFSMITPQVNTHLLELKPVRKSAVVMGVESHACVLQTVLDLLEGGWEVQVVVDAVSSRSMVDRMFAIKRMAAAGAHLTTCESLMFLWCTDATHPSFKQLQTLIKEPTADSGLLTLKEV